MLTLFIGILVQKKEFMRTSLRRTSYQGEKKPLESFSLDLELFHSNWTSASSLTISDLNEIWHDHAGVKGKT